MPGGLLVMSYVMRLTPLTSLVMREEILRRTAGGKWNLREAGEESDQPNDFTN